MNQLIYHAPDSPEGESPFDREIARLAAGADIKIVSPYIGLSYLKRLVGVASSWRLISDVHEWLTSQSAVERQKILCFLQEHEAKIHHIPGVHAKAVIAPHAAYTGSANLTLSGVLRRTELGMVVREMPLVTELHHWFDSLWTQTSSVPFERVNLLVEQLDKPELAQYRELLSSREASLESSAKEVRARLVNLVTETNVEKPARPKRSAGVQLNLDEVVARYVGLNAVKGFTLRALHERVQAEGPENATVQDTYMELLNYCGSRPRSFFWPDALNRLVYQQGVFRQSEKARLSEALAHIDTFIESVIKELSFAQALPLSYDLMRATSPALSIASQRLIIKGLVSVGMLSGEALLQLNEGLEWTPRLKLLPKSFSTWNAALTRHRFNSPKLPLVQTQSGNEITKRRPADSLNFLMQKTLAASPTPQKEVPGPAPAVNRLPVAEATTLNFSQLAEFDRFQKQIDRCFLVLAMSYNYQYPCVQMSFRSLVSDLCSDCDLPRKTVSALLLGEYPRVRSPFRVKLDEVRRNEFRIYDDIIDNETLKSLPLTLDYVNTQPHLHLIEIPGEDIEPGPRLSVEEIDMLYVFIARRIAELSVKKIEFESTTNLMQSLCKGYPKKYAAVRVLIDSSAPSSLQVFQLRSVNKKSVALWCIEDNLEKFPYTKGFLLNYRRLPDAHPWFKIIKNVNDPVKERHIASVPPLTMVERDEKFCHMVTFIGASIAREKVFSLLPELYAEIGRGLGISTEQATELINGAPHAAVELFEVKYLRGGFALRLNRNALRFYPKTEILVKTVIDKQQAHSWITATPEER